MVGGQSREGTGRSGSAERSHVVWAGVLQVVELQLQLAYSHVLRGQLVLQPPQFVLLPEEHPQELEVEDAEVDLRQVEDTFVPSHGGGNSVRISQEVQHLGNREDYWDHRKADVSCR